MKGRVAHAEELEPVRGQEAFHRQDPTALQSQAAFLLLLGRQLRHREPVTGDGMALGFDPRGFPSLPVIDRNDLSNLIETLYEVRTGEAAANVIEACLYVPDALVRVAAAAARTQMARDASPAGLTRPWLWARSFESLMRGVREEDELVRELAATALDVLRSDLPPTFGGTGSKTELNEADQRYGRQPKPTSVIVHGPHSEAAPVGGSRDACSTDT